MAVIAKNGVWFGAFLIEVDFRGNENGSCRFSENTLIDPPHIFSNSVTVNCKKKLSCRCNDV